MDGSGAGGRSIGGAGRRGYVWSIYSSYFYTWEDENKKTEFLLPSLMVFVQCKKQIIDGKIKWGGQTSDELARPFSSHGE